MKHTNKGGGEILDLGVDGFGLRTFRYILHPDSLLNRISSSEHWAETKAKRTHVLDVTPVILHKVRSRDHDTQSAPTEE